MMSEARLKKVKFVYSFLQRLLSVEERNRLPLLKLSRELVEGIAKVK